MTKIVSEYYEGEWVRDEILPDPGKLLVRWYDMDTTDYHREGTWEEIQEWLVVQDVSFLFGFCIVNFEGVPLELTLDA